jgi:nicotinate-nucleotide adenylyltransferase
MLALAVEGHAGLYVDPFEIEAGGVSYTIETVRHFLAGAEGRPGLVIGEDLVPKFDTWREADELARLADLIVAKRADTGIVMFERRHIALENALIDVSSSDVREMIASGREYRSLVPAPVADYIEANALYR